MGRLEGWEIETWGNRGFFFGLLGVGGLGYRELGE